MKFFCCAADNAAVRYASDAPISANKSGDVAFTIEGTTISARPFGADNTTTSNTAAMLTTSKQFSGSTGVVCSREDSDLSEYHSCCSLASGRNSFTSCTSFDGLSRTSSLRHESDALILNDRHATPHAQHGTVATDKSRDGTSTTRLERHAPPLKTIKALSEFNHTETPMELISCLCTPTDTAVTPVAESAGITSIHERALQSALDMYQAHGHPCAACQVLLNHCQAHGMTAQELSTHLEGLNLDSSPHSQSPPLYNIKSMSRSLPARGHLSSTGQEEAEETKDPTTPSPRPSRPHFKHSGSGSSSFRRAASSSASGALQEDEMGLDEKDMLYGSALHRLVTATISIENCVHQLLDDTGWQVVRNDLLKLMYQHSPGTSVHSFKARCILEAPIEHLVALTREFDLCSTWNTHCKESVVLKEWSFAELLVAGIMWLPWPLPYAQLVLEAVGTDLLEMHGGFLVTFHTPDHMKRPRALPGVKLSSPKNLSIAMRQGSSVFFEPLHPAVPGGPPRTRSTVEVRCDVGLKHVPSFVITFVLKVLAPFVYNMAVKLLAKEFKDPTRPIPSRIPQRPDLYGLIRRQAAAYLARKKA